MIRFKCIYCGQRILAPDNGVGKKGKCPKCGHEVRVLKTNKRTSVISGDITEREKNAKVQLAFMNSLDLPEDTVEL